MIIQVKRILPLIISASVLIITSCKKDEIDNETQSVVDNTIAESEFIRIIPAVNFAASNNAGVKKLTPGIFSCASVTLSGDTTWANTANPPALTFDYGNGCSDSEGRTRSGKIKAVFSEPFDSANAVVTITFDNYYADEKKYEGNIEMKRISSSSFSVKTSGGKVSGTNYSIGYDCDFVMTMTGGNSTINNETDDIFEITGTANAVNRSEKRFTVKINAALVKSAGCKWIQSGKLELTPEGLAARSVDYGSGACDNKATFSVNGNTFEFPMQ